LCGGRRGREMGEATSGLRYLKRLQGENLKMSWKQRALQKYAQQKQGRFGLQRVAFVVHSYQICLSLTVGQRRVL